MDHKVQHSLQQAYLRGFSPHRFDQTAEDYEKDWIWTYKRTTGEIRIGSIPKVAARPYQYSFKNKDGVYSHTLESGFANLDRKFSGALTRINGLIEAAMSGGYAKTLTPEDHTVICEYLFTHIIRVPAVTDWLHAHMQRSNISVEQEFDLPRDPDSDQLWTVYALSNIGGVGGSIPLARSYSCFFEKELESGLKTGESKTPDCKQNCG